MATKTYRHIRTGRTVRVVEGTRLAKLVSKDDGYEAMPESGRSSAASSPRRTSAKTDKEA